MSFGSTYGPSLKLIAGRLFGPPTDGVVSLVWAERGRGEFRDRVFSQRPVSPHEDGAAFELSVPSEPVAFSGYTVSGRWLVQLHHGARLLACRCLPAVSYAEVSAEMNPFRTDRVRNLGFRLPSGDVTSLFDGLRQRNWRGALVGDHGSGKTTLMNLSETYFEAAGFRVARYRLNPRERLSSLLQIRRDAAKFDSSVALLLDSFGDSWWPEWQILHPALSRVGALLACVHRPNRRIPTLVYLAPTPQLLTELIHDLVPEPPPDLIAFARGRFKVRRANVRQTWGDLFDWWSDHGVPLDLPLSLTAPADGRYRIEMTS